MYTNCQFFKRRFIGQKEKFKNAEARKDTMTEDFYCDEVLNGKTKVEKVLETDRVLAYYHTNLLPGPYCDDT